MESRKAILILSMLLTVGLLSYRLYTSLSNPPQPLSTHFVENLALAGEFSGPLPLDIDKALTALALRLEDNPAKRAVMEGKPAEDFSQLPSAYRLWSSYLQAPSPAAKTALQKEAYERLLRLLTAFVGGSLLAVVLLAAPWLFPVKEDMEREWPAPSPTVGLVVLAAWLTLDFLFLWMVQHSPLLQWSRFDLVLLVQAVSYLIAGGLLFRFWSWKNWKPWRTLDGKKLLWGYLATVVLLPLVERLTGLFTGVEPAVQLSLLPYFQGLTVWQGASLSVIAVIFGPVFEELLFRGFLLGSLRSKWGDGKALLLSSLIFAAVHGNFWGFPVPFVFGLITGKLALRTGSLTTGIALHCLWNLSTLGMILVSM